MKNTTTCKYGKSYTNWCYKKGAYVNKVCGKCKSFKLTITKDDIVLFISNKKHRQ